MRNNNHISFEDDTARGEYSRYLTKLLKDNNIHDWAAYPSPKKGEIIIHPLTGKPENERTISRVSVQVKDGSISFGLSGYNYIMMQDMRNECEPQGYNYHKKDINKYGVKEDGRCWLTKAVPNLESIAQEFKKVEHLLQDKG
jgi:hypothetical protein